MILLKGPEDCEEENEPQVQVTTSEKSSSVGRVMTQEEFEEWKDNKKPIKDEEEGVNWGFGML